MPDSLPAPKQQARRELGPDRQTRTCRLLPHRLGHRAVLPATKAFWCRGAARPPIALSVMRSALPPSIRSAWICSSSAFLSEERGEWPDIDLDLPSGEQRERAIQYVYQRYGELGAAMTANVITYRGRSAAREAGKALGFDAETLNRLDQAGERLGVARRKR